MKRAHLYLLSILSGLIFSLGWPADGWPVLLFFGFVPLLFVMDFIDDHKTFFHKYSIFQYAYLAFFVWNVLTTWWIWNSTIFGGIMAFLLNSLFFTLVFTAFHLSKRSFFKKSNSIYLLVVYWLAFEYFHLDWDLSWPWLNLGNGFAMYPKWIQWYEYTGTLGGSLWILCLNVLIYNFIKKIIQKENKPSLLRSGIIIGLVFLLPLALSLKMYYSYEEKGETTEVVIVQPNLDPWNEQFVLSPSEIIKRTLDLTQKGLTAESEFVVCPESSIQEDIWLTSINNSRSAKQIKKFIRANPRLNVIIGSSTFRLFEENEPLTATARKFSDVDKYYEAFNTALFFNNSENVGIYHKSKLVPGPEKLPFQNVLKPLQNLAFDLGGTVGSLGFSENREVFCTDEDKFRVPAIICYESTYGEFVSGFVRNGANLLFVITNDGWWGNSPGHKQHLSFSILRAIENRRAVARSANTGISCFINQRGDILQQSEYWKPAVLNQKLQANNELTFYAIYGDYIGRISAFIAVMMLLISISIRFSNKTISKNS